MGSVARRAGGTCLACLTASTRFVPTPTTANPAAAAAATLPIFIVTTAQAIIFLRPCLFPEQFFSLLLTAIFYQIITTH